MDSMPRSVPMRLSVKLFGAFVALTSIVLILTLALARLSFQWGFLDFINGLEQQRLSRFEPMLLSYYQDNGNSWQGIDQAEVIRLMNQSPQPRKSPRPRHAPPPRKHPPTNDVPPTALFDRNGNWLAGDTDIPNDKFIRFGLYQQNTLVAELRSAPPPILSSNIATHFSRQQTLTSIIIGVFCLSLAMIFAWWLTKRLLQPILAVKAGLRQLASGQYGIELSTKLKDELGELVADVNQLSQVLAQIRDNKNRLFADISHELRTPLTIMAGELEAMQAGIRPINEDAIASLDAEVKLLRHLVDDLYALSTSELGALRYQFVNGDLSACVNQALDIVEHSVQQAGLTLKRDIVENLSWHFDSARVQQIVLNIIANAIKYTDVPGEIEVLLQQSPKQITLTFSDTAPSCTEAECQQLFEPLFRKNKARTREQDHSAGLGLAIVKNIVEAHHGQISAAPATIGGLCVTITFEPKR